MLDWSRACGAEALGSILREHGFSTDCAQSHVSESRYIAASLADRLVIVRCSCHENPAARFDYELMQPGGNPQRRGLVLAGKILADFGVEPLEWLRKAILKAEQDFASRQGKRERALAKRKAEEKLWFARGARHRNLGLAVARWTTPSGWKRKAFLRGYKAGNNQEPQIETRQ